MKRIFLCLALVLLILLPGCTGFEGEERAAQKMLDALASALEEADAEKVRSLFAPFVVEQINGEGALDADIRHIMEYISGDITDKSIRGVIVSDSISREGYKKDIIATYLLQTTSDLYKIHFVQRVSAWGGYKGKGILYIEVWSETDIGRAEQATGEDFVFRRSKGCMGIWYPVEYTKGTPVAGTKCGREFEEP